LSDTAVLEVRDVTRYFGAFQALGGVSLEVPAGSAVGLVGPNGSGKTTLINVVSGVHPATKGKVLLSGEDLENLSPTRRVHKGLNRTFQVPRPLKSLTVAENVAVAARSCRPGSLFGEDPLDFVGLSAQRSTPAGTLTTGSQKLLDLARALATGPDLLLVDELGAGLSDAELEVVAKLLRSLASMGLALVVVEHLLGFLEAVVDSVIVLDAGRDIFHGTLKEAVSDPRVIEVFLGSAEGAS